MNFDNTICFILHVLCHLSYLYVSLFCVMRAIDIGYFVIEYNFVFNPNLIEIN